MVKKMSDQKTSIRKAISSQLFLDDELLISFIRTAPYRYKTYEISKRNSEEKRQIAHPSKELKAIQRIIIKELENNLPVHEKAFAYKENVSIKENALAHVNSSFLLKMDISSFFNSISPDIFWKKIEEIQFPLADYDKEILTKCLFYKKKDKRDLCLSVGAPSSPMISNFIMFNFDKKVSSLCKRYKVIYTRYADDMTFSTKQKGILLEFPKKIARALKKEFGNSLKINNEKTVLSSKAHNRHVTGITLSNQNNLSLGRERKRSISAKIHHYQNGKLKKEEVNNLKGLLAFCKHIEPSFIKRMEAKYSKKTIEEIIKWQD